MIQLTAPDGKHVWVFPSWVQLVRHCSKSEYAGLNVGSVIILSGFNQAVREFPEDVITRLGGHNTDAKE